ncbi:MAG: GNAT family N-acetyltransferase [Lachnospiraceae bacterium]|nr:GNAT family N-acetyltransferase [Lachnospiraceae bacterium]
MKLISASDKKLKKRFLGFRKKLYRDARLYVDNNYFMLQEIFGGKLHFTKGKKLLPVFVEADEGKILCEAVFFYAPELPDSLQLCFFESLPEQEEAVDLLLGEASRFAKEWIGGEAQLIVGLSGHVNYGLGLLASHYEEKNSFSSPGNPEYYNEYFRKRGFGGVWLNSYIAEGLTGRLDRYSHLLAKLDRSYSFRSFDKKHFERDAQIYTELNNLCFADHRYYYKREAVDDAEMLKELFLFMKEDSLIYAFRGEEPAGFILWYPDYNELAERGEAFGVKHYFRNIFGKGKLRTGKVMEYGVLQKYRGSGLALALIREAYRTIGEYGYDRVESSWILAENEDSNSFCSALCDGLYKKYVVYEKAVGV